MKEWNIEVLRKTGVNTENSIEETTIQDNEVNCDW